LASFENDILPILIATTVYETCSFKFSYINGGHNARYSCKLLHFGEFWILVCRLPENGEVPSKHLVKVKVKVNCTLVQALWLCTGRTAQRGSRRMALLFLDHGIRTGWGVSVTPRPLYTPGKDTVPILQEAGWAPGPVWTGAENLASTGTQSRTIQPVASHYNDWATRPTNI